MSVLSTRSVRGVLRTSESESESLDGSIRVGFRFRDPCFGSGSLAAALRRGERFWSMAASTGIVRMEACSNAFFYPCACFTFIVVLSVGAIGRRDPRAIQGDPRAIRGAINGACGGAIERSLPSGRPSFH